MHWVIRKRALAGLGRVRNRNARRTAAVSMRRAGIEPAVRGHKNLCVGWSRSISVREEIVESLYTVHRQKF
jgi:hypothetical protein